MPGFDGHVGPGTDRDTNVGRSQGGCVVHAVTHHRDLSAATLQLLHLGRFVLGEDFREHGVDTEVLRYGIGDGARVPGQHGDFDAALMQRGNGLATFRPDRIRHREDGECAAIAHEIDGRLCALRRGVGGVAETFRHSRFGAAQQGLVLLSRAGPPS